MPVKVSSGQRRRVGHEVLGDDLVGDAEGAVPQAFHGLARAALAALDMAVSLPWECIRDYL
ncbi:MAG: hypothetical protein ACRDMI_05845 [Streptosporangiaceae bacterium]